MCHREGLGESEKGVAGVWRAATSPSNEQSFTETVNPPPTAKHLQANHIGACVVRGGIMLHLLRLSRNQQLHSSLLPA